MLRLYAGRENIDKERFIYDRIKERRGRTLVLVPNQYTLAAEEQALQHLGTDCLFDVEILSMNRLGLRMLREQGKESVRMLDKYGRFMLLTKIIKEHSASFDIFRRSVGRLTFTAMLNDFISEFKQQNLSSDELEAMIGDAEDRPLLKSKIAELDTVIKTYEDAINGLYTDPEDYISMYIDAIRDSGQIADKTIWVYGYDSVTPKFVNALIELTRKAENVNFIINRSDFGLDEQLEGLLMRRASEERIEASCEEIRSFAPLRMTDAPLRRTDTPLRMTSSCHSEERSDEESGYKDSYLVKKSKTIEYIEKYLWRDAKMGSKEDEPLNHDAKDVTNADFVPEDLTLVCAANPYYEAENAAAYIWHLIRDMGYRMSDIQVIANDEGAMQPIIRRVFAEYGLPVFSDAVRNITDTAAVASIVNLLRFEVYHRAPQFIFAVLKSGVTDYTDEEIEELENYVRSYHIKGTMWDRDFKYGSEILGEERFAKLNDMRTEISAAMNGLTSISKRGSVYEFTEKFKTYLEETWHLSEKVEEMALLAEERGLPDEAQRLLQSYDKAIEMLGQMTEIMGGEELSLSEFTELYVAGLTDVEVGVIPDTEDGLSLGTMIRTRPRPIKAAVVLGVNEGVLPLQPSTEGLFSIDEKDFFKERGFALGSLDDIRMNEENAAMYRMMSGPSEKLYISYSLTDTDGKDASPSPVIDSLKELFPQIEKRGLIKRDIISEGWGMEMLQTVDDAMRHLAVHIKDTASDGSATDELTLAMLKWYRENRTNDLELMRSAAEYDNVLKPIGRRIASALYKREGDRLRLSASAIGNYFDCPFKYYVNYGLRPLEERDFRTDARSIGDAYHECLMAVARKLVGDRALLQQINSGDDAALEEMVNRELSVLGSEYRGGLFVSSGSEKFRMDRIREICAKAAAAMAAQLGAEAVTSASLEEKFGAGGAFEPIIMKIGDDEVYVEGKIDRADVLSVGSSERIRIIDYKTGRDSLDLWKMRQGLHMQLMIYLISASTGSREPAGMFYFNIKDPIESANDKSMSNLDKIVNKAPEDMFKLKGAYIDEEGVLDAMPKDVLASTTKDSTMSREDYESLRHEVIMRMEETASGIHNGEIDIHPLREDQNKLACNNCSYKSICRRDGGYSKNYSRMLKPKPKKEKNEGSET